MPFSVASCCASDAAECWFVRYLFDGSARRYRIGEHPAVGLSAARKIASVVRASRRG
jgi:hypothetical protein